MTISQQIQGVQDWLSANNDVPGAQEIASLALEYLNSL